jgi:hypothetical protein
MKYTFTHNGKQEKAQKTANIMTYETSWRRHASKKQNNRIKVIYMS